jgi:UPF0042 nucleotide-binding protein
VSGAGRSTAADVLEDLGIFEVDNLPPELIPSVVGLGRGENDEPPRQTAVVVDVRAGAFVDQLGAALGDLRAEGATTRVLFLDASDDVLVRRYLATRRKHPLAAGDRVSDGIAAERRLLEELKGRADLVLDTSHLNVHELRQRLLSVFGEPHRDTTLQTSIVSFGYKHGLPVDVDLVFDCRFLPNPNWVDSLRPLTGNDPEVREYVKQQPSTRAFLEEMERLFALLLPAYVHEGKSYLSIGVGCTGGRHRSVVIAGALAEILGRLGFPARIVHRDLARDDNVA